MHALTPIDISTGVTRFCRRICHSSVPVYVPVQPESDAIISECFPNVESKIQREGGYREIGWQIWEWPNVFIEAEFHAIWKSPGGQRIDVTPKPFPVERILFLPNSSLSYTERQVDNIRQALRDDKVIRDLIRICEAIFRVTNEGERRNQHGLISIPAEEIGPLIEAKEFLLEMLRGGLGENSLCGCKSNRKYKNCCGKRITRFLRGGSDKAYFR